MVNKKILKAFKRAKDFDEKHFRFTTKPQEQDRLSEYLKKVIDSYYTFSPEPPKNKPLFHIRKALFKYLFRYSFKQVIFNDLLRNILVLFNQKFTDQESTYKDEILSLKRNIDKLTNKIEIEVKPLLKRIDELEKENKNLRMEITVLSSVFNSFKGDCEASNDLTFFSQFGEDKFIVSNLKLPEKGFFVDVGAGDGITFSNTYYFEKNMNWSGLCFEPDPRSFQKAKKIRKNIYQIAISKKTKKESSFYLSDKSPDLSTLDPHPSNSYKQVEVKSESLESVLSKNKVKKIDLISIDTEGTELDVWSSFDYKKYKPTIVIVEYKTQGREKPQIMQYFKKLPYKLIHQTEANFIFTLKK